MNRTESAVTGVGDPGRAKRVAMTPGSTTPATVVPLDSNAEWVDADGLGGFASGTVSGIRTRRYHALLLTATTPPAGRMVLVNGFDAWVENEADKIWLSAQRYFPDSV